ncbi:MAG: SDR family oxidoreductase, partial [Flavobacteriales bacterium]
MAKKILVTGANGLLGQKIVDQLKNRKDVELIATSRGENRRIVQDFSYYSLDITLQEAVESMIATHKPDAIINTAAMTNVDACEDDQENCWDINVNAVKYLLASAKKHGSHLIHLSTDFVFDGEEGPYEEKDKPNPLAFYAESKLASEKLINESNYRNTAIARTIIVFGNGDNLSRGNLILWAKGALEKQSPINV